MIETTIPSYLYNALEEIDAGIFTGDYRKDAIIKRELFEEYIKDKYYVEFILDDRIQVEKIRR